MTPISLRRNVIGKAALLIAVIAVSSPLSALPVQAPAATGFTYQGRLTDGDAPARGLYDFEFTLYDALKDGTQIGSRVTHNDIEVTNGLFTVILDFGAVFSGSKRWLQIGVRPAASDGEYVVLKPRQELTPTPDAVFSQATPWAGVSGKPAGFADNQDNDVLGGLSCGNNEVPKWNGTAWACAADADGDITGITAGTGLTGGGTAGGVTVNVNLAGSGSATTISRSDHNHAHQKWTDPFDVGLSATFVDTDEYAGIRAAGFYGVIGETSYTAGRAVFGRNSATTGFADGVFGQSAATTGRGVVGYVPVATGINYGVWGQSDSTTGRGVFGLAAAASGTNYGVYGQTNSATGYGVFSFGRIGTNSSIDFGNSTRQMLNLYNAEYAIGVQPGTLFFRSHSDFAWYFRGGYADAHNNAGTDGVRQMRLDFVGNLYVRGTVNPGGADFAEMLPAQGNDLEPGDVLVIGLNSELTRSTEPYQSTLAGVYSTKPGLLGGAADGEDTTGKIPLAVAGVVPVKVTDENGAIRLGDSLTSSSTPGHAMRASKVTVGGISFFPSGVVIGKALEPLTSGKGLIRALVVMQ